jgi:uncharacterized protein involved in type VI secretion and phage assembly
MDGLVETMARPTSTAADGRIFGVAVAQVIDNTDLHGLGRVQLSLAWLPGYEPWARVGVLAGGSSRGTFFIPQIDDEVLVAFEHGDIRQPYVIGGLWNGQDHPPCTAPEDARNKQMIRSSGGHEILIDDGARTITIKATSGHKITIDQDRIELKASDGNATLIVEQGGVITVHAETRLSLDAPTLTLRGDQVEVEGRNTMRVRGGSLCSIDADLVTINS